MTEFKTIIAFLIGLFCGGFLGIFLMALLSMAGKASRAEEIRGEK